MDYKLKYLDSVVTSDKVCYPFSLQSVDDLVVHRAKLGCEIISMNISNHCLQSNLQLTSIKTPKPTAYPRLNINYEKVFHDCNHDEKNAIMLNSYFLPDCTAKNTHYLKCLMAPYSERTGHVLACLSSSGVIELFNYNADTNELTQFSRNLSDIKKETLKKVPNEIAKFELYKSFLYQISFTNFEWCPIAFDDFKILLAVTKAHEIVFYRIQNDAAVQENCISLKAPHDEVGSSQIKWMDINDEHFLLVSTSKGDLIRYAIDMTGDGVVKGMQKRDEIKGQVRLPISHIAIDYHANSTIVLCCKNHSLEIFQFNEKQSKLVLSKYIDLTITGVEVCSDLQYFISVLNAKVYYLKLNLAQATGEIALENCSRIEIVASNADDVHSSTKYGFYGVSSSRNHVLVYLSCYPQIAFDHLANKQPVRVSVNLFTKYNPFAVLMENPSLRLTDFADCIEAVQHIGSSKLEALAPLEQMDYSIRLDDEFAYYLKIQLTVVNTKLIYYKTRSSAISEIIAETRRSILEIIAVIHFYKLLNILLKLKSPTTTHCSVIRASSNQIREYCDATIEKEPFKTAAENFRPQLLEILRACEAKIQKSKLPPEMCDCCGEVLAPKSLECCSSHRMKRCVVTNLLVSLDCGNFCRRCMENATNLETLTIVLGDAAESNGFYLCPYCDSKLALYE